MSSETMIGSKLCLMAPMPTNILGWVDSNTAPPGAWLIIKLSQRFILGYTVHW